MPTEEETGGVPVGAVSLWPQRENADAGREWDLLLPNIDFVSWDDTSDTTRLLLVVVTITNRPDRAKDKEKTYLRRI